VGTLIAILMNHIF